jgi:hypothetical protein
MHPYHRARGKVLFEVLCAWSLAASFAGAWGQTGSSALLASAAVMSLFSVYWAFGLVGRDTVAEAAPLTATVVDVPAAEVESAAPEEVFAFAPEALPEPEPVAAAPKKQRARKGKKAAAAVAPVVEAPEPVVIEEPVYDGPPLQQLFEPQPFVRQPRPAFGRKSRGPRPVSVG